jgi:hypothetical protein
MKKNEKNELARIWNWSPVFTEIGDQCICCRKMVETHEVEGVGIICWPCFQKAKRCKHEGCETPATKTTGWECRAHYIGEEDKELHVDDFGGFRQSSLAACADDGSKKFRTLDQKSQKDLREAMIRHGIPTRIERRGNSFAMIRVER